MKQRFTTTLQGMNIEIQVTIVPIPFSIETVFGTKGKLDVKGGRLSHIMDLVAVQWLRLFLGHSGRFGGFDGFVFLQKYDA